MMTRRVNMCDFVRSGCESVKDPKRFMNLWFRSKRNPCSICGKDKSKCVVYREFVTRGTVHDKNSS